MLLAALGFCQAARSPPSVHLRPSVQHSVDRAELPAPRKGGGKPAAAVAKRDVTASPEYGPASVVCLAARSSHDGSHVTLP